MGKQPLISRTCTWRNQKSVRTRRAPTTESILPWTNTQPFFSVARYPTPGGGEGCVPAFFELWVPSPEPAPRAGVRSTVGEDFFLDIQVPALSALLHALDRCGQWLSWWDIGVRRGRVPASPARPPSRRGRTKAVPALKKCLPPPRFHHPPPPVSQRRLHQHPVATLPPSSPRGKAIYGRLPCRSLSDLHHP